jgi:hypothetical protein
VVLHDGEHGVDLQVGPVQVGPRAHEGAGLQEVLPPEPLAEEHVVQADAQRFDQALAHRIDRDRQRTFPGKADVQVVLQVLPDAFQRVDDRYAVRG